MGVNDYIKLLEQAQNAGKLLICNYCGTETLSAGDMGICSNCECILTTSRSLLEQQDVTLPSAFHDIESDMSSNNYDGVLTTYDKLIADRKEPGYMYAAALANLRYSNNELMQINYNKPGFMEENALHRDKAAKLASVSKKLLARGIKTSKDELAGATGSLNITYTLFLLELKLGRIKQAKASLDSLAQIKNDYVSTYANMIFSSRMDNYKDVLKYSEQLMKGNNFSINAFYYAGLALFKMHRLNDAMILVEKVKPLLKTDTADALIAEISYQLVT